MNLCFPPVSWMHSLLFLFCWITVFIASCMDDPAYLEGEVSINCGSAGISAARNDGKWFGDTHQKFISALEIKGKSTTSTVVHQSVYDNPIPYGTARISRSIFTYSFRLSPGQKFIRFHFINPTVYKGFKKLKDLFSVKAGPFTLLGNFSASLTADALGVTSFTREFCIEIKENQALNIVFSPENSGSLNTYAFVNGIEIIPVASGHSYFHSGGIGAQVMGHESQQFYVNNGMALEMVRRVKVTWDSVSTGDDHSDMFGVMEIVPKEKANDMIWKIHVDVGFRYLIRLYFSNRRHENGKLILKVFSERFLASTNVDIAKECVDNGIFMRFIHNDYVVTMEGQKEEGKHSLTISLVTFYEFMNRYKLFTGFEIFKLSNPDNSLASPNPLPLTQDSTAWTIQTLISMFGNVNFIAAVAITLIALVNIILHKLGEIWKLNSVEEDEDEEYKLSVRAGRSCRCFSLKEIQFGTANFSDAHLIGKGGFGYVYKCLIDNGSETVAVKRLKENSRQGAHEFLTEIETLSELRHINLVSLIGYCKENKEMIIVYEYMENGTLADHLYWLSRKGNSCSSLNWKKRLNICIEAGRGLDYLHTGSLVIHRDVKVSNILLDKNFTAKVSDFGLVKQENRSVLQSHVSTKVKGTFGYLDPNYVNTGKLTRKSDTYAFGVVLLEVLCGRPAIDPSVATDERILTKWARNKISKGEVDMIVDSNLRGEISRDSLKSFIEVVERCLNEEPKNRSTMAQVVLQLELALEQQDTTESSESVSPCNDATNSSIPEPVKASSTNVQTSTPIPQERFNYDMDNSFHPSPEREQFNYAMDNSFLPSPENSRATEYKPSWLPWSAVWKKFKSSKKNEVSIPGAKLPKFDLSTIAKATNQFSHMNVIGQGGFGPVYKAMLATGQIVAVKRLLSLSDLTQKEFETEILLLQNLHHRNIIKLIGYGISGKERVLVYDFLENGSLDSFIYGEKQRGRLQWTQRMKIIMGIARGLQYLHQDSGLRIIHRDPKLANILLDTEMNPRISDFGIARTFEEDHSYTETRITGTLGYICPAYISTGMLSTTSDVYTFGVAVLEIVSGKRRYAEKYDMDNGSLVKLAWRLWSDGRVSELMDESIEDSVGDEVLRCIQVGLLCTRKEPRDRPTMSSVITMLDRKELICFNLQTDSSNEHRDEEENFSDHLFSWM